VIEVILIMIKRREAGNTWKSFIFGAPLHEIYTDNPESASSHFPSFCCGARSQAAIDDEKDIENSNGDYDYDEDDNLWERKDTDRALSMASSDVASEHVVSLVEQMRRAHTKKQKKVIELSPSRLPSPSPSPLLVSPSPSESAFTPTKKSKVAKRVTSVAVMNNSLKKYGVNLREIFAGIWMKMRFGSEEAYRTR